MTTTAPSPNRHARPGNDVRPGTGTAPEHVPADPRLGRLAARLEGELLIDDLSRTIYSTDASEYQERPLAVALPRSEADVRELVRFAAAERIGLIPRTAGTSLAGQVVGAGIVVDAGRHLDRIVSLDVAARRVRVQPGVVRNALNRFLAAHGLFFGPETSTAAWAMIGGMVGNNSCGSNSIAYGSTRDHLVSARGFLADGSEATFGPLSADEFAAKCAGPDTLETRIYRGIRDLLGDPGNRRTIRESFPRPEVTRRNTGYALDALLDSSCFEPQSDRPFNLCRLLAGSEGTLFLGVEFELNLIPLPPPGALLCLHCESVDEALRGTLVAMRHRPTACELIDRKILDCTRDNLEQSRNRAFVVGDPGAVLVVEVRHADRPALEAALAAIEADLRAAGIGYAFPRLFGDDGNRVWELRRAGQGLVNNIPGDARPREIVEDTAVAVEDLPAYIAEFDRLLGEKYGIDCIHYAHAGAGELHLRPLFDLRSAAGLKLFRDVATDVAALVRKYRGSLSGEHGDGRLRGEFIRSMVGDECFALLERVKRLFDPAGILNPGKIIDTPPMDASLRIVPGGPEPHHETLFNFDATRGVLRAAEKCSGVGQCRKSHLMGGTMCPSYMATRDERHTTRARANTLRQALASPPGEADPWNRPELAEVMELCLSCKACKSECPSNVDMARLKAEWEQHWHDAHGVPLRSRLIAGFAASMRWATLVPWLYNFAVSAPGVSHAMKRLMGFATRRSLPPLHATTVRAWWRRRAAAGTARSSAGSPRNGRVHLFCDEFTDTLDTPIGIKAIELLEALGYEVVIPPQVESGRAHLSKGLLREARDLAARNVELLADLVTDDSPLVGIEPSAILGFRDEYPDLVPPALVPAARRLAGRALLVDEFLAREAARGRISADDFTDRPRSIRLHGHCHQKALASLEPTVAMLSLPRNHSVETIPSGCCGMAGSFGYEREHFDLSMEIGELVLFPAVRGADAATLIAAPGTSCRHQIKDGTGRTALHPVEILHAALRTGGEALRPGGTAPRSV
ncbi:MAG: FAD-binding oxidoreductase [Planctomycetia bacterium]|nr:FAD-binding oxidoreductase [Planctomycetia bacterium]